MGEERLLGYGEHLHAIAQIDIAQIPSDDAQAAIQYAVLGTALYEPILAALLRLAHQDVSSSVLGPTPTAAPTAHPALGCPPALACKGLHATGAFPCLGTVPELAQLAARHRLLTIGQGRCRRLVTVPSGGLNIECVAYSGSGIS